MTSLSTVGVRKSTKWHIVTYTAFLESFSWLSCSQIKWVHILFSSPKFVQRKNRTINKSINHSPLEWAHYQYENTQIRNRPIIFVVLNFIENNANTSIFVWKKKLDFWKLHIDRCAQTSFADFCFLVILCIWKPFEYNIYSLIFTFQYDTRRRAKKSTQSKHDVILQLNNSSQ